jgi:hypothetical protein
VTRFDKHLGICRIVLGAGKMRRTIVKQKALSREEQVDYLAVRHFSSWPNGLFSRIAQNLRNKDIGADGFLESLWLDLKLDVGSGFDLVAEKIREVDLHGVDWDAKELPSTERDWIKKRIAEAKEFLKTRESWSTEDLVATYQEGGLGQ